MSNFYRLGLIVVACTLALVVAFQFSPAQDKAAAAVQKWEYKCVPTTDELVKSEQISELGASLSHHGNEGWELAWIIPAKQGRSYQVSVFKRPKP